jgi:anti-sigma factor RsiW
LTEESEVDRTNPSEADRALEEVLETRLPRYPAPAHLKRRLAEQWPSVGERSARRPWWRAFTLGLSVAAASAVVVSGGVVLQLEHEAAVERLSGEAVNDHLRILEGAPLAQVTGGLHEVKPWFGGKIDFAPELSYAGDAEFPLQGGAVEAFLDRRAAAFVFKRRLHTISLFILEADGRRFPRSLRTTERHGFNVALWKQGDQGYALVSDLNLNELLDLQGRIAGAAH